MNNNSVIPPLTNRGVTSDTILQDREKIPIHPPKVFRILQSVDWLTMTIKRSSAKNRVAALAYEFASDSQETGHELGSWARYGYEGYYCNGLRWGRRDTDDLLQLSSDTAGNMWLDYVAFADNVSRMDLAVTIEFMRDEGPRIIQEYQKIQRIGQSEKLGRLYSLVQGTGGGATVYVGSRSSSQFGRLYDKAKEANQNKRSSDWFNCIRWEVEFKSPLSGIVASRLWHPEVPEGYILATVANWFRDRNIWFPDVDLAEVGKMTVPRVELPDEKRMAWLRKQVAPTVNKLLKRIPPADIAEVLGLPILGGETQQEPGISAAVERVNEGTWGHQLILTE